jgi:hypothetical protein
LFNLKLSKEVKATFFERAWPDDVLVILLRSWAEAGEAVAKRLADRLFRRLERIDKKKKLMDIVKSCREYDVRPRNESPTYNSKYKSILISSDFNCSSNS